MADRDKLCGHMKKYGIIQDRYLPDAVRDELCNDCPGNDCGVIINPEYRPLFAEWLKSEDMPIDCYIIWFSW